MHHDQLLEAARGVLASASLAPDDLELWTVQLASADDERLTSFLDLFHDDPALLARTTEIMKLKLESIADPSAMGKLVAYEKEMLQAAAH